MEKKEVREINNLVGKPFSFLERLKMKGIGSSRMILDEFSAGFKPFIRGNMGLLYCNVELRPNGIMVHFNQQYNRYSWVIPYYRLSMFRSDSLSIHAEGEFLRIRKDKHLKNNSDMIKRILDLKEKDFLKNRPVLGYK
jgi:hypothetical protein